MNACPRGFLLVNHNSCSCLSFFDIDLLYFRGFRKEDERPGEKNNEALGDGEEDNEGYMGRGHEKGEKGEGELQEGRTREEGGQGRSTKANGIQK